MTCKEKELNMFLAMASRKNGMNKKGDFKREMDVDFLHELTKLSRKTNQIL